MIARTTARLAAAFTLLCALALAPRASAEVLVVAAAGGDEFTSLTVAVNAAQHGDLVLVRPGTYTAGFGGNPLIIVGKSLSIVGDGTGPVIVGPILVGSVPAGSRVLLRNLTVMVPPNSQRSGLRVQFCPGTVWAEDCVFPADGGIFGIGAMPALPGVSVANSGDVLLVRCQITGGEGVDSFFPYAPVPGPGGEGVRFDTSSHLTLHECIVSGGPGGDFVGFDGGLGPGGNGGVGVSAFQGNSLVSGCTVTGGDGGSGDELVPTPGYYLGGHGIDAVGAGAAVRLCEATLQPGAGGPDGAGGHGAAGQPLNVPTGSVIQYAGAHRSFEVSSPTPENTNLSLTYAGKPGDLVGVYVSLSTVSLPLVFNQGTWVIGAPVLGPYVLGTVSDPSGVLALDFVVPDFGFGRDDAVVLYEQVFAQTAGGKLVLSSPTTHVIVDGGL